MDMLSFCLLSITFCILVSLIWTSKAQKQHKRPLPPGPLSLPLVGNLLLLKKSLFDIKPTLKQLWSRHGPIVAIPLGSRPVVFISDRALAHQALVQKGAVFADRPRPSKAMLLLSSNQHNISTAGYGPLWRLLRRTITSEILHPSRVRSFAQARKWVLSNLVMKLKSEAESSREVVFVENFRYAMFSSLLLMCFGEIIDEAAIRKIMDVERRLHVGLVSDDSFAILPTIGKLSIFGSQRKDLLEVRRRQDEVYVPLIRRRRQYLEEEKQKGNEGERFEFSYVDSLLELELQHDGNRKLTECEIISLCSEFLNAGMDTTTSVLQWVMANLVKYPEIQRKLADEIESVVVEKKDAGKGDVQEFVEDDDLQRMVYLKAVVMEALRRHSPGHFLLPHAVAEEVEIGGYVLPKGTVVNFEVAEMGFDERVWEEPMEFRPERFVGRAEVDLTGSREMKMIPFGAGRRICPGMGLAMLHLEYFLANLVREFEWKVGEEGEVDLAEKHEFTVVMKSPLKVKLLPRNKKQA